MKIVINICYGGFGLSPKALMILDAELGIGRDDPHHKALARHDPLLVRVVEQLGDEANGHSASLKVIEISDDRYHIEEYDGWEGVWTPSNIPWIIPDQTPTP